MLVLYSIAHVHCGICRDVRVLFSTTISESLRANLVRTLKRLGGKDAGKQATDFTHFLTIQPAPRDKDLGFKKSFSTLLALAAGKQGAAVTHRMHII